MAVMFRDGTDDTESGRTYNTSQRDPKLIRDDDGKDLYDRSSGSIDKLLKIDPSKWREPAALDLMKDHYLRVEGKMTRTVRAVFRWIPSRFHRMLETN